MDDGHGPADWHDGPDPAAEQERRMSEPAALWLYGLGVLAVLAVPLLAVRGLADDASVQILAERVLGVLTSAVVGGLLWQTWRLQRADGVRVPEESSTLLLEPMPAWPRDAIRRARRRAVRGRLRWAVPVVVLVLLGLAAVAGSRAQQHDATVLCTQPVREAVVVDVRDPLSRTGIPDVVVEVDGREVVLALSYPGSDRARVGDVLPVVVDPDDPAHVLATTSHDGWEYTVWGDLVLWGTLVPACVGLACWRLPSRRALRAARTVRTHRPARVVTVAPGWVVLDDGRDRWVFEGQEPAGPQVVLLGEPAPGAWVVLDDGRTRLPSAPLRGEQDDDGDDEDDWDDDEDGLPHVR
ncbi:hypothetical protein [Cellulomonas wangsupingiae]|uniref:DUF3592 domain-containing protein n=1 Tax=Cellulomonas wangsupingiae TaxID=2968085 RepID=A0ABY5K4S3_9CELL|nr:hypothetical protein [Cellulomonas wangsupingiae]MCC2336039.1 hypothetical protein [Cellulomonas wangsupingiae]UUI64764.1 hypothetical protein NP075_16870 [Cellulomonas wangsupingiae]